MCACMTGNVYTCPSWTYTDRFNFYLDKLKTKAREPT